LAIGDWQLEIPLRIALGADHRGFRLKEHLVAWLEKSGHAVLDMGTFSEERTDYPVYAVAVARAVGRGRSERGILVCGSGIGMSMAANRVKGVRAALANDARVARMSRLHNDANVLCLGADFVSPTKGRAIAKVWLETPFEGGRHVRRLRMLERAC